MSYQSSKVEVEADHASEQALNTSCATLSVRQLRRMMSSSLCWFFALIRSLLRGFEVRLTFVEAAIGESV